MERVSYHKISCKKEYHPIFFFSDMHYGNWNSNEKYLKEHLAYARKVDASIVLLGDEIEGAIRSYSASDAIYRQKGATTSKKTAIEEQIDDVVELFKPFKGKILAKVNSTHTQPIFKSTGIDVDKQIAERLGADYLEVGDYMVVDFGKGKQTYKFYVQHGSGGSQNPAAQLEKAMKIYPDADIYAMGHIHQKYAKTFSSRRLIKEGANYYTKDDVQWGIRTGGYLDYPQYAHDHMFPLAEMGTPLVELNTRKKKINVILNGFL